MCTTWLLIVVNISKNSYMGEKRDMLRTNIGRRQTSRTPARQGENYNTTRLQTGV
jgi:hypothetical protein